MSVELDKVARAFIYTNETSMLHSVGHYTDADTGESLIHLSDGMGGWVQLAFDNLEDLDNFKYILKCFFDEAEQGLAQTE